MIFFQLFQLFFKLFIIVFSPVDVAGAVDGPTLLRRLNQLQFRAALPRMLNDVRALHDSNRPSIWGPE